MSKYVQTTIFDYLEGGQYEMALDSDTVKSLERKGFEKILPLGTSKKGNGAYRAIFEDKPCTVQIDKEGHIIVKHDDSRFWDVIGGV